MSESVQLFPSENETIAGVTAALRAGERSCVDVVQQCLSRVDERESQIHAWVSLDRDGALQRARQLDDDLAAGKIHGPLHGIPIGIKDIVDVAGVPTAAGSKLMGQTSAEDDSTIVARLRAAGAVILGKTVTTQFACFDPPVTRNPWNTEHTPGGSSSGSAAAVASGMCLAAIGSQTGGSITRPASYCGVAGCKPTIGRVSVQGVVPLSPGLDHPGPIARSVGDLALLLDVISGYDPDDPLCADETPTEIYETLAERSVDAPRLGRLHGFFDERADDSVRESIDSALATLRASGAIVVDLELPESFQDLHANHRKIMLSELAAWHELRRARHPDDYQPGLLSLVDEGLTLSAVDYVRAREHQSLTREEIVDCFDEVHLLVCPATTDTAPDLSTTGDPAFNSPWSYIGLPTVSFPIAVAKNGLPLAIQLIGRPFDETDLFQKAAWCEQVIRQEFQKN